MGKEKFSLYCGYIAKGRTKRFKVDEFNKDILILGWFLNGSSLYSFYC